MTATLEHKAPHSATTRVEYVLPSVNIREEEDAYVLEADMPGVNKDSLEIALEDSELTLVGRRVLEPVAGEVLLREQRQAEYRRVFEINPAINKEGITARMNQGVLTLTLPKAEEIKPRKITESVEEQEGKRPEAKASGRFVFSGRVEQACYHLDSWESSGMGLPAQPQTLSVEQIDELNKKLSTARHDINNHLSMVMAAAELIRMKPDKAPQMSEKLLVQPAKITALIKGFSEEFERALGITRP